jgi:hypothetical protein
MRRMSIPSALCASALFAGCVGSVTSPVAKTDNATDRPGVGASDGSSSPRSGQGDADGGGSAGVGGGGGSPGGGGDGSLGGGGSGSPGGVLSDARVGDRSVSDAGLGGGSSPGLLDSGPVSAPLVPKVQDCAGLAAEGVFEEITPPQVKAAIVVGKDEGGTFAIAVDPVNQGTLYVGTRYAKVWKSVDCGATWTHISTGRNGASVDSGMNWTFAIDPQNPQVVYTNSGYGDGTNGLYKSSNGGVDWDLVWPPPSQPELAKAFEYNFANVVDIDPSNHLHILLTFHEPCLAPHAGTCIAESTNGGSTWRLVDGQSTWDGREGQVIFFLNDSNTWLWGSQDNGFWRSGDRGVSWQAIKGMTTSHLQGSQLLRSSNGTFFMAGADGIWRSPDGAASTWSLVKDTGPIVGGLVTNGSNMFASTCYFPDSCTARYLRSAQSDGQKWTEMKSPAIPLGGTMGYDRGHNLLYSSNLQGGLWRVVAR